MGLDVGSYTLAQHWEDHFEGEDDGPSLSDYTTLVSAAIREQTGHPARLPEPSPLTGELSGRIGSYSSLHVLRRFAARQAGYPLSVAYGLPPWKSSLSPLIGVDSDDEAEEMEFEDDLEAAFVEDWGVSADEVIPLGERQTPFPFPHFVLFSDCGGLYLPIDFPHPIVIRGSWVGSLTALVAELRTVGRLLKDQIVVALEVGNVIAEDFLLAARAVWWRLRVPAEQYLAAGHNLRFL